LTKVKEIKEMFTKSKDKNPADWWQEYEKGIGEKVETSLLGQYLDGWPDFSAPLWGLLMLTAETFRFHHFPHESWLQAISRTTTGGEAPSEKTFSVPRRDIASIKILRENSWWRRILFYTAPILRLELLNGTVVRFEIMDTKLKKDLWETDAAS
jgi:hypothetical protein